MTGLPEFNYPAFHAMAARLRARGFTVESPAENPTPACGTWAAYMAMSIPQMLTCDVVATLDGWIKSSGARVELREARTHGKGIVRACDLVALSNAPPHSGAPNFLALFEARKVPEN
jgi:hypothetical protein